MSAAEFLTFWAAAWAAAHRKMCGLIRARFAGVDFDALAAQINQEVAT